jgi:hypothetical protein
MRPAALLALLLLPVGCDKPSSSTPEPPSGVTSFHVSIFNACNRDVVVEVAEQPNSGGRQVHLFNQARETITGGAEKLHLIGKGGEVLATYTPSQGDQKAQVSSDCTAIEKMD